MNTEPKKRPTIDELEAILKSNESLQIVINPDGSIRAIPSEQFKMLALEAAGKDIAVAELATAKVALNAIWKENRALANAVEIREKALRDIKAVHTRWCHGGQNDGGYAANTMEEIAVSVWQREEIKNDKYVTIADCVNAINSLLAAAVHCNPLFESQWAEESKQARAILEKFS